MSTVTKQRNAEQPAVTRGTSRSQRQLRKDRIVALIVLVVVVGLMAAMMWLASISGAPADFDYWPMMP